MWRRGDRQSIPGCAVAHRAGAALAGGDPIAGVRELAALGTSMIEFDVRATADGVLVVHHDPHVSGVRLADRSYAELASEGHAPPLLVDLLAVAAGTFALDVELKEPGYEHAVVEAVLERASREKVVFTSFDDAVVATIARQEAGVGVGLILGRRAGLKTPLLVLRDAFPFARLDRCGADFLVPSHALLATGLARRAKRRGVGLLVWNVDDPAAVARLRATPGVLGVVTDSRQALTRAASSAGVGEAKAPEVAGGL